MEKEVIEGSKLGFENIDFLLLPLLLTYNFYNVLNPLKAQIVTVCFNMLCEKVRS